MQSESAAHITDFSASTAEFEALGDRLRCVGRQSNHSVVAHLLQLNQQSHRLEAELLLYLGELDRRQLYREQATASAFEFCVSRMGYSEDVAFKRVGAARLMRRFPLVYELLVTGRIHLTALMLLKPQLTLENHEEWLLLACKKSKRQVEQLVASRCPRPDVPSSIRKLPGTKQLAIEANPEWVATDREGVKGDNEQAAALHAPAITTQATPAPATLAQAAIATAPTTHVGRATTSTLEPATSRVTPLSSKTYRVTFTASEQLKQKLDRASELLSHCIHPSDVPALLERALDQLLEREEKRRYGARPPSNPQSVEPAFRDDLKHAVRQPNPPSVEPAFRDDLKHAVRQPIPPSVELEVELDHKSCQNVEQRHGEAQDPDLATARIGHGGSSETSLTGEQQTDTAEQTAAAANTKRRRCVPAAVRRAVFERDGGQCTFVDAQGRRCEQRHYLEFDHMEPHALGGTETTTNLRLRCAMHNALAAEKVFGRDWVNSAIKHAQQVRR